MNEIFEKCMDKIKLQAAEYDFDDDIDGDTIEEDELTNESFETAYRVSKASKKAKKLERLVKSIPNQELVAKSLDADRDKIKHMGGEVELEEYIVKPFDDDFMPNISLNSKSLTLINDVEDQGSTDQDDMRGKVVFSRKTPENRVREYSMAPPNEDGTYTIPAKYGPVTLISIGSIVTDDVQFHNDRYIFPVGYHIKRPYLSAINPSDNSIYECTVSRDERGPLYEVTAMDSGKKFTGRSSSGAWASIVQDSLAIRNRPKTTSICGPDLFGFTCPEIAKLVQDLPGSKQCSKYKWQKFIEK